jgi:hypothetical protein
MTSNDFILITSGSYANQEITSDFGLLPTSFLPVGHKRIIEYQLDLIKNFNCQKIVSLPYDFDLKKRDEKCIFEGGAKVWHTNPKLKLSESIIDFIDKFDLVKKESKLYILHGDTLFSSIKNSIDSVYYGFTNLFYKWGNVDELFPSELVCSDISLMRVLSGYFSFSSPAILRKELCREKSFEKAIVGYHKSKNLTFIKNNSWLDFGHSNLYYSSKVKLNVTRNFNQTKANKNYIKKVSKSINKIRSEYDWFMQVPEDLILFIPRVWGYREHDGESSYNIEFIGAPTLQEKWVFGGLPNYVYVHILNQAFDFIQKSSKTFFKSTEKEIKSNLYELYIGKTKARIKEFKSQTDIDFESPLIINGKNYNSVSYFLEDLLSQIKLGYSDISNLTFMHGDLCFSNMLFDSRNSLLKLIDPRGGLNDEFDSKQNTEGDFRYDISKLGHSVIGNYDYIVTGFYDLEKITTNEYKFQLQHNRRKQLESYFFEKVKEMNVSENFIKVSIVNLFISMLPLHSEEKNRQIALLINAYNLYYNLEI